MESSQKRLKLDKDIVAQLKGKKNLLALSMGADSSALFALLMQESIEFDVVSINHKLRVESDEEVAFAKSLTERHNKKFYTKELGIIESNFEANARNERYSFFCEIIDKNSYENLILAHHLNDKLEWFLMQLSKGAGAKELFGFSKIERRENFSLVRPFFNTAKSDILSFIKENGIKYFEDKTNEDESYKRNYFRKHFANEFLEKFEDGVKRSFELIEKDLELLVSETYEEGALFCIKKTHKVSDMRAIDISLKKLGLLMSSKQRVEIEKEQNKSSDMVIENGDKKMAICFGEQYIYVAPFVKEVLNKKDKDSFRVAKVPPKLRGYMKSVNLLTLPLQ